MMGVASISLSLWFCPNSKLLPAHPNTSREAVRLIGLNCTQSIERRSPFRRILREGRHGVQTLMSNSYFSCLWGGVGFVGSLHVLDREGKGTSGRWGHKDPGQFPNTHAFPALGVQVGTHEQTFSQTRSAGACIRALSLRATQQEAVLAAPRGGQAPSPPADALTLQPFT